MRILNYTLVKFNVNLHIELLIKVNNDVRGCRRFHTDRFEYRYKNGQRTNERKSPPPHGYVITKGSAHIAATRQFAEHALTDRKALDLLDWMSDIKIPDEHFFQTLNHNPLIPAPGAFSGTLAFSLIFNVNSIVLLRFVI